MASDYLRQLAQQVGLTDREVAILQQADVRSPADVDSLTRNFPSIADVGVRLNLLSNAAGPTLSAAYAEVATRIRSQPPQVALGAAPPPGVPTTLGASVGLPSALPPPAASAAAAGAGGIIDLRLNPWPVRDQNPRGTCVAFGTTACVEHFLASTTGPNPDFSEQFLYWAIKDHSADPIKMQDGTWLTFARAMLASDGICRENLHPYVNMIVSPVSGAPPSAGARTDAAGRKLMASTHMQAPAHAATIVRNLLSAGRPVAICVPVFKDPAVPNGRHNWDTEIAWAYGRVINPPVRSIVDGGHCVCVTGFVPDSTEPLGGYFIFRNSWGTIWAANAPSPGATHSPERGYGEISATYVDTYCWELMQL